MAQDLEALARVRFATLSAAELKLLKAVALGDDAFCGPSSRDDDPANDPANALSWGSDRLVRADLVRWLCTDKQACNYIDARGVKLYGAKILETLDLSYATVPFPLGLTRCYLEDLNLLATRISAVSFNGSHVRYFTANRMRVSGSVYLEAKFHAENDVNLVAAHIENNLVCDHGNFASLDLTGAQIGGYIDCRNSTFDSLVLTAAQITGYVDCRESTFSSILAAAAQITRNFDCSHCTLGKPGGGASDVLGADRLNVGGNMWLRNGFTANGPISLRATSVGGDLDLSRATVKNPGGTAIAAQDVSVKGNIFLSNEFRADGFVEMMSADVGGDMVLSGGSFQNPPVKGTEGSGLALRIDRSKISGSAFLTRNFSSLGTVSALGIQITGDLVCTDANFAYAAKDSGTIGDALLASRAKIGGSVYFDGKFVTEGRVSFVGAQIGGDFVCSGAHFTNPPREGGTGGLAFEAGAAKISGTMFLDGDFNASGTVSLVGAQLGTLQCIGSKFLNSPQEGLDNSGKALSADGIKVDRDIYLSNGFTAEGSVSLRNAEVGSDLVCTRGSFHNQARPKLSNSGDALIAAGIRVRGTVYLSDGFSAQGRVSLFGAQIAGSIECGGGKISNPPVAETPTSGTALTADQANVTGLIRLDTGFAAEGCVSLVNTAIGSNLECTGGSFSNPAQKDLPDSGKAFLVGVRVTGDIFLDSGFTAKGLVALNGAQVGGDMDCTDGLFEELDLKRVTIKGYLKLNLRNADRVVCDLQYAYAGVLQDGQWNPASELKLDGFVYGGIAEESPRDLNLRLSWLKLQTKFTPQPYRQLAKIYRQEGQDSDAKKVFYEMEKRWRKEQSTTPVNWRTGPVKWLWSSLLRVRNWIGNKALRYTIGYGYYSARAFWLLLVLILLSWILYGQAYFGGLMTPTNKDAHAEFREKGRPPDYYQPFNALVYAVDNSFSLVHLGQNDSWSPDPTFQPPKLPVTPSNWSDGLFNANLFGHRWITGSLWLQSVRCVRWCQLVAGWLLTLLFVAGVSGVTRKE